MTLCNIPDEALRQLLSEAGNGVAASILGTPNTEEIGRARIRLHVPCAWINRPRKFMNALSGILQQRWFNWQDGQIPRPVTHAELEEMANAVLNGIPVVMAVKPKRFLVGDILPVLREWEAAGKPAPTDEDLAGVVGCTPEEVYRALFRVRDAVHRNPDSGTYRTRPPIQSPVVSRKMTPEELERYGRPLTPEEIEAKKTQAKAERAERMGHHAKPPTRAEMEAELKRLEAAAGVSPEPESEVTVPESSPEPVNPPAEAEVQTAVTRQKYDWPDHKTLLRLYDEIKSASGNPRLVLAEKYGCPPPVLDNRVCIARKAEKVQAPSQRGIARKPSRVRFECETCRDSGLAPLAHVVGFEFCECRIGQEAKTKALMDKALAAAKEIGSGRPEPEPIPPEVAEQMEQERAAADAAQVSLSVRPFTQSVGVTQEWLQDDVSQTSESVIPMAICSPALTPEQESELQTILGEDRAKWEVALVAGNTDQYWAWPCHWAAPNHIAGTWSELMEQIRTYVDTGSALEEEAVRQKKETAKRAIGAFSVPVPYRGEPGESLDLPFELMHTQPSKQSPALILIYQGTQGHVVFLPVDETPPEPFDEWPYVERVDGRQKVTIWTCIQAADMAGRQIRIMVPPEKAPMYLESMGVAVEVAV